MVRVTVPATSANMGSGYDSIGIALELYNVIDLAENDHIDISDKNGQYVPQDESNLIYQCAKRVYDECGKPLSGLTIVEDCAIPQTRGLGSSSACTVAGIMGANMLLGEPLDRNAVIDLAATIEGHPDNSTPAILGGFCVALLENGSRRDRLRGIHSGFPAVHRKGACGAAQDNRPSRCGLQSGARSAARGQPDHRQAGKP